MFDLAVVVDELWKHGAGPDDRPRLKALLDELAAPGHAAGRANAAITVAGTRAPPVDANPIAATEAQRTELALFYALLDLMQGSPASPPVVRAGPIETQLLAAAAAVWAGAVTRDVDKLERTIAHLERILASVPQPLEDERVIVAHAWVDLAIGEAALAAGDRTSARHRLESVARGTAPPVLRIAATLRIVTLLLERVDLEQARTRCRQAASLADSVQRPMHAQHARVTGAILDFIAGDRAATRRALTAEAEKGPLGLLPRILLSSFEPPERAMPLIAEGLADAGARGDAFAFTICTIVGARRYADADKDGDALLVLTTAIHQLQPHAPSFATALEDERRAFRNAWGPDRYAAAEQAALALFDG